MPLTPNPGAIAPAVSRLVNVLTAEISNLDANPIERYLDILITHPVAGLGFEIKVLWALSKLGEFNHPKQRIQKWMRANFEQMRGSLSWSVAEMMLAIAIGYSFSEFSVRQEGVEWRLDSLLAVDPRTYRFEGVSGQLTGLKVRQPTGQDATIPYEKGVHVINQPYLALGRDPYGIAQVRRIVAAYEAWKILVAEMIVCGQRQATPIIVAKVPTGEYIVICDQFGNPEIDPATGQEKRIAIADSMVEQLEGLDNRSVLVTDLRNEIEALQQMTGASAGNFFFEGLRYLERIMLMGEVVPETVVSTGISGTGDSGLNTGHMALMEMSINATLNQIKEGLLERVCRPLTEWRFGNQASWGAFEVAEEKQEDAIALVKAIEGICDGPTLSNQDLEVVNRTRELVGIPPTDKLIQQMKDERLGTEGDASSAAAA